jgi:heme/copper-type cytochrome/quinol oxidase subunit 2
MADQPGGRVFLLPALGLCAIAAGVMVAPGLRGATALAVASQDQAPTRQPVTVSGRKYAFEPARIEVQQNDLVKISFTAEDIPHSFTIDDYRIAKRAGAGQTVVFEFRADKPGTFDFYCNLAIDDGCKKMRGRLTVRAAQ